MAQQTQQIYTDNPGGIPATFALPPGLDLVIQSIVARWNGAAAAGSFKPCLSVYSQDDRLVGRFFPNTDLDTGDTAVVTYAPFLRGEAEAAAGGGLSFANVSTDNVAFTGISVTANMDVTSFTTNDATAFDLGSKVIGGTTYHGVRFLKNGVYRMWVEYLIHNATAADEIQVLYNAPDANEDGPYINQKRSRYPLDPFTILGVVSFMVAFQVDSSGNPPPSQPMIFTGQNKTSATGTIDANAFYDYLGAGTLFP